MEQSFEGAVDMFTAVRIQEQVANRLGDGFEDMTPILEGWTEEGFDESDVAETINQAVEEFRRSKSDYCPKCDFEHTGECDNIS